MTSKKILVKKKCKVCGSKMIVERKYQRESRNLICEDCKKSVIENENKKNS